MSSKDSPHVISTAAALRRALLSGLIFFAVLMSLGNALAGDVSNTDGSGTLQGDVNPNAPVLWYYNVTDGAGVSKWGAQLDVQTTYTVYATVNAPNGWASVTGLYVNFWWDGGSDGLTFANQASGSNFKLNLSYTNAGSTSPTVSQWAIASGNWAYTSGSSSIAVNAAGYNYSFRLAISLNAMVRAAPAPTTPSVGGYKNIHSWNAQLVATDTSGGTVTYRSNQTTTVYYEFGVYQYTHITVPASWDAGAIAPGASGTAPSQNVVYSSNANYTLKAYLNGLLTSGGNTIPADQVQITGGGLSNAAFSGIGVANSLYLYGDGAPTYQAMDANANDMTVGVSFKINVPLGTPVGAYSATVTFALAAKPQP